MLEEPQFEITDLVTQYYLHPELRDFFVEGQRDKEFYQRFLDKSGCVMEGHCYEVRCVNIHPEFLKKHKLSFKCERDKVITLALELAQALPKNSMQVTCIADVDFGYLLNTLVDCQLLLYTDYTCLEMYTLTREVLGKFLAVGVVGFPIAADKVIKEISSILVDLFLIRATNIDLGLSMTWLGLKGRRFKVENDGTMHFDTKKFVRHYLEYNNMPCDEKKFWMRFGELKKRLSGDLRRFIRGHDYVEVMGHYLYKVKNNLRQLKENPEHLTGTLLICLETKDLCKEHLFVAIVSRLNEGSFTQ